MKTILMTGVILLLAGGMAVAGILNTKHNLSSTLPVPDTRPFGVLGYLAGDEDRICVFCHTPHGGELDAPLWNRDLSSIEGAGHYTHYTSDTVSTVISGNPGRPVNAPSLACLSCHDGSIGVGNLISHDPDNWMTKVNPGFGEPGPKIGANRNDTTLTTRLDDDHPISFSYSAVYALKPAEFQTVTHVEDTQGLLLYGANENVECGTCHDPHVDATVTPQLVPFLRISNAGSAMCLSCHIK